ncbi:MAG TPA: aldolase/citrate lyase family protein [Gemmatales bacterium]|nr:aldolase/citrate lyase family protein [Gemmatales bacterium]HMP18219.1 aldolase/citrate lyase family protein [Gemmatales bacterium]
MRNNPVKRLLHAGKPTVGSWISLGNVLATRYLARAGFDWLTIDMEHGAIDWELASNLLGVIADAGCVPLVRVPCGSHDHIKRALDAGAYGIVVPMVMSRTEAESAVKAAKYPPTGNRSVGGGAHALNFETTSSHYYEKANDEILVILQCEHINAVNRFDEIFSIAGIDAVFVGPNDLARSLYSHTGEPPAKATVEQTMQRILQAGKQLSVPVGLHTFNADQAKECSETGWQFIAVNSDLRFMLEGASMALVPFADNSKGNNVY